jgi:hypothetical protein
LEKQKSILLDKSNIEVTVLRHVFKIKMNVLRHASFSIYMSKVDFTIKERKTK